MLKHFSPFQATKSLSSADQVQYSIRHTTVFKFFIQKSSLTVWTLFGNPLSMCRIPWHTTFFGPYFLWAATHAQLWVHYSLPLKSCVICVFFALIQIVYSWSYCLIFTLSLSLFSSTLSRVHHRLLSTAKWWRPRGVRRRVENLSAAHPTDLGPRGACAFKRYKFLTMLPVKKWIL